MTGGLLLAAGSSVASEQQFLVETTLWLEGQARQVPAMVVKAREPAFLMPAAEDGSVSDGNWRLQVEVDPVDDPLIPTDSLWVNITIDRFENGTWENLTDSMLGVPEGEIATLSVVDGDNAPDPTTAQVYLEIRTSRLRPASN